MCIRIAVGYKSTPFLEEKVFGELNFKFRPPDGWPAEIAYTNQLLWDNVPEGFQFFRSKIADPSAVRRPHRERHAREDLAPRPGADTRLAPRPATRPPLDPPRVPRRDPGGAFYLQVVIQCELIYYFKIV